VGEIHMDKGRVGDESKGKETDGCPLTKSYYDQNSIYIYLVYTYT
jgi:hypothetical protein